MRNFKRNIAYYSQMILLYFTGVHFLMLVFFHKQLPLFFNYSFLLLLGALLGYKLALWAVKELKKDNRFPTHEQN